MKKKILSRSPSETRKLGASFAKKILNITNFRQAKIISLEGRLGGGKTTFLKGFARTLGLKEVIRSPSFVIMKKYRFQDKERLKKENRTLQVKNRNFKGYFYHFDCYRIENEKEVLHLHWKKIIVTPKNIVAIEWGDKIRKILPKNYFRIRFEFIDSNTREIYFKKMLE